MKTLVIDASNIKAGGGLIHLKEFVANADFLRFNIHEVVLCAPLSTISKIPDRDMVTKYSHPWFNGRQWKRAIWQRIVLRKMVTEKNAILFIPGTGKPYFSYPFYTMARNLLPIDLNELSRYKYSKDWVRYKLLRMLHFQSYTSAKGLICMNQYTFNAMPESVRKSVTNLAIIPHGLNPVFKTNIKTSYHLSKPVKMVYVSRLNLYKHQWHVAKAAYMLAEKGYNIQLELIGKMSGYGAPLLEKVMSENELTYPGVVRLVEEVAYKSLPEVYKSADIFIFASTCETFGMILLEAMGSGIPIACSNKSSMKEMLLDGGVYFDPENPDSICEAVKQLLDDEALREKVGQRAHQLSLQYDWKKTAEETLKFISESQ